MQTVKGSTLVFSAPYTNWLTCLPTSSLSSNLRSPGLCTLPYTEDISYLGQPLLPLSVKRPMHTHAEEETALPQVAAPLPTIPYLAISCLTASHGHHPGWVNCQGFTIAPNSSVRMCQLHKSHTFCLEGRTYFSWHGFFCPLPHTWFWSVLNLGKFCG